ncbi:MerR family transcriptional regulator [Massilibacterium senegalense]|uniref:MerR family transcriptional regulator n=1 Tax=Massilibacterium senegalense TaxID=1632858 RepID=UPI0007865596|nr:B12-binding domain-containing protein [Massilibacterium senegalense]
MASQEGKYNIKAVSQLIGIQPGTLRAWERRYHIVEPVRNKAGHRLYTDEHVRTIRWLADKVNKGFNISQAVSILENKRNETGSSFLEHPQVDNRLEKMREKLYNALMSFDERKAHAILDEAFSLYSIDKVLIEILATLLVNIGDEWEKGFISVAHEHFATSFLRTRIGNIFHMYPVHGFLPKVIAVCGLNEQHELGLLIFVLHLRRRGFDVVYLGAGIPAEDVKLVLQEVRPRFLFISCTLVHNVEETLALVDEVSENEQLVVGLGGQAFEQVSKEVKEKYQKYLFGSTPDVWDAWLDKMLAEMKY